MKRAKPVERRELKARVCSIDCAIEKMREALAYYANVESWSVTEGHEHRTIAPEDLEEIQKGRFVAGRAARAALKGVAK